MYFAAQILENSNKMAGNKTLTMIKPDAVRDGHIGAILNQITEAGFRISAMKLTQLSADAQAFYAVHKERPFFGELVEFMTSGPIVAAVLEKDNVVEDFRTLIGATNPAEAAEGTIRARCEEHYENAVHGSDSNENAQIEGDFHFAGREQFKRFLITFAHPQGTARQPLARDVNVGPQQCKLFKHGLSSFVNDEFVSKKTYQNLVQVIPSLSTHKLLKVRKHVLSSSAV